MLEDTLPLNTTAVYMYNESAETQYGSNEDESDPVSHNLKSEEDDED